LTSNLRLPIINFVAGQVTPRADNGSGFCFSGGENVRASRQLDTVAPIYPDEPGLFDRLVLSSFSDDPCSGLVGVLAHVDSLKMLVEHASQHSLVVNCISLQPESHAMTRRAVPLKETIVGGRCYDQFWLLHLPKFPRGRGRLLALWKFKLTHYRRSQNVTTRSQRSKVETISSSIFPPSYRSDGSLRNQISLAAKESVCSQKVNEQLSRNPSTIS
jgi:hypothetical protein